MTIPSNYLLQNKQCYTLLAEGLIILILTSGTMELLKEDYLKKHHPDVVTFMKVSQIKPILLVRGFSPRVLGPGSRRVL